MVRWSSQTAEAIGRKVSVLAAELERFSDEEYPRETKLLRYVFDIILKFVSGLVEKARTEEPESERELRERLHVLGGVVNQLYAMTRYLRASDSVSSPPALQAVVRALVRTHSPRADRFLTIVRPQWKYNCKFVSVTWDLGVLLNKRSVLIPEGVVVHPIPHEDPREIRDMLNSGDVNKMLTAFASAQDPPGAVDLSLPDSISVLSLAGLDREDVLMYPMIAHEVAHMLSFQTPPGSDHKHATHHSQVAAAVMPSLADIERYARESNRDYRLARADVLRGDLNWTIVTCIRELLADLTAARMLGVGYFLTLHAFLSSMFSLDDPLIAGDSSYPSMRFRLKFVWDHLKSHPDIRKVLRSRSRKQPLAALGRILRQWDDDLSSPLPTAIERSQDANAEMDQKFILEIAAKVVIEREAELVSKAEELVPTFTSGIDATLSHRIAALRDRLPPLPSGPQYSSIPPIFTAAWLHRLQAMTFPVAEHERLSRLVSKAIELASLPTQPTIAVPRKEFSFRAAGKGVLSGDAIRARMLLAEDSPRRLSIVPLIKEPVTASIDVHLGHWFKVARRPKVSAIDLTDVKKFLRTGFLHDEFYVEEDATLTLHAGDFALGITREFIGMPRDAMAFVEGKSSVGRTGLIVATATQVAPGFHGCLVLELVNSGSVPLKVGPGMAVAQLVFITTSDVVPENLAYKESFDCQIKP